MPETNGAPSEPAQVDPPPQDEQIRQLAELLVDMHRMLGVINTNRKELIPGEHQDEYHEAWVESSKKVSDLTKKVLDDSKLPPAVIPKGYEDNQLTGSTGKLKRSLFRSVLDEFYSFFKSEPRTDELRQKAQRAGARGVDFLSAIVDSIPGGKAVVEFLSVTKHLLELRANRGF